jgi:hypothetical protein
MIASGADPPQERFPNGTNLRQKLLDPSRQPQCMASYEGQKPYLLGQHDNHATRARDMFKEPFPIARTVLRPDYELLPLDRVPFP